MKKKNFKSSFGQFASQQLNANQISQVKGGNGDSTENSDIVIADVILI